MCIRYSLFLIYHKVIKTNELIIKKGLRTRTRECNNLAPKYNGSYCIGDLEETDTCYDYSSKDCLSKNQYLNYLPFNVKALIKKYLFHPKKSYIEEESVELNCNNSLKQILDPYYPNLNIDWLFNGVKLSK